MVLISGVNFKFKCYRCNTEKNVYSELPITKKQAAYKVDMKNNKYGSVCVNEDCRRVKLESQAD